MTAHWQSLFHRLLDGAELDEAQAQTLADALEDPERHREARQWLSLEAQLSRAFRPLTDDEIDLGCERLMAEARRRHVGENAPADEADASRGRRAADRRLWLRLVLAAAAVAALAVVLWALPRGRYPPPRVTGDYTVAGGGPLRRGAIVHTGAGGARLELGGYCHVAISPSGVVRIAGAARDEQIVLTRGRVLCDVASNAGRFAVATDLCSAASTGARFIVELTEGEGVGPMTHKQALVRVLAGVVLLGGVPGRDLLKAGEEIILPAEPAVEPAPKPAGGADAEPAPLWMACAPMLTGRRDGCSAVLGSVLYAISGGRGNPGRGTLNEAYDPAGNQWTRRAPIPHRDGRYSMAAVACEGRIYTVGGINIWGNYANDNVDVYDPGADRWTARIARYPAPVAECCCVAVGSRIYCFGGLFYRARQPTRVYDDAFVFDTRTRQFRRIASLPTPLKAIAGCAVDSTIYLFGGSTQKGAVPTVLVYDTVNDSYSGAKPLSVPLVDCAIARLGQTVFLCHGRDSKGRNGSIFAYDLSQQTCRRVGTTVEARGVCFFGQVGSKLIVAGGYDGDGGYFDATRAYDLTRLRDRWETDF